MNRQQREQRRKDKRATAAASARSSGGDRKAQSAAGPVCRHCGGKLELMTCEAVRAIEAGRIAHERYDAERGKLLHTHYSCAKCGRVIFVPVQEVRTRAVGPRHRASE